MAWEYKVMPAPAKGQKARGIKGPAGRFAHALQVALNTEAAEGWEFWRAETLPSEERSGLTGSQTIWRHVMIFRRPVEEADETDPTLVPVALIEDNSEAEDTSHEEEVADEPTADDVPDEEAAEAEPIFEHTPAEDVTIEAGEEPEAGEQTAEAIDSEEEVRRD